MSLQPIPQKPNPKFKAEGANSKYFEIWDFEHDLPPHQSTKVPPGEDVPFLAPRSFSFKTEADLPVGSGNVFTPDGEKFPVGLAGASTINSVRTYTGTIISSPSLLTEEQKAAVFG